MTGACERIGLDGKGKDGLIGFYERVGSKDQTVLATLTTRAMPLQVKEDVNITGGPVTVNIISIPPSHSVCPDGKFRPDDEAEKLWQVEQLNRSASNLVGRLPDR